MEPSPPFQVIQSDEFKRWLGKLRDHRARVAIERRIGRIRVGNLGDTHSVGNGIAELRINFGPGYRAYFVRFGRVVIVLLCGGDKSSQAKDIALARRLAEKAEEIIDGSQT